MCWKSEKNSTFTFFNDLIYYVWLRHLYFLNECCVLIDITDWVNSLSKERQLCINAELTVSHDMSFAMVDSCNSRLKYEYGGRENEKCKYQWKPRDKLSFEYVAEAKTVKISGLLKVRGPGAKAYALPLLYNTLALDNPVWFTGAVGVMCSCPKLASGIHFLPITCRWKKIQMKCHLFNPFSSSSSFIFLPSHFSFVQACYQTKQQQQQKRP